ncbi:MAG: tetratricopeptide repeat protein [Bacteroidia bacterium]
MKKIALIVIITNCLIGTLGYAQQNKIDALVSLLKTDAADTNKVKHLYTICNQYYLISDYDKGIPYGKQALGLAKSIGYKKGMADSYHVIALIYDKKGNFPEALKSNFAALKIREEIKDKEGIADSHNSIGAIYNDRGNYPEALKNHFASLKIYTEIAQVHPSWIETKKGIANSYTDIGNIYYNQANYPEAVDNYFSALKIFEDVKDKSGIAQSYSNIGNIYDKQGNYTEAITKHFVALDIQKAIGDKYGIANSYRDIGDVYDNQADYPKAIKMYLEALTIYEEIGDTEGIAISDMNIGQLYTSLNKTKEAQTYLAKSLALSKAVGLKEYCRDSYFSLAIVDSMMGNYKAALAEHKLFIKYRDSLSNEQTEKQTLQSAMQYEYDKKEAISKAEEEKKDAAFQAEEHKQKIIIWAVLSGLLIVVVFAGFVVRSLRVTNRQKVIIEKQKHIVEEHQKEIIDSINYAERIQRSFIATKEILDENLCDLTLNPSPKERDLEGASPLSFGEGQGVRSGATDYFVFFKPKDIVSGDFYWASKLSNGNFALATADSTGHGVPGAIMSLLNITSLEKAIETHTQPSDILNATRKTIIERLKKDGSTEGGKDGMDAILTVYDFKNNKLIVAAANNPVWIVRGKETIEIKPDKMPVGKHDKQANSFTQQEITLQSGDVVYTLTDGFPDQFGGEKGKKFMSKNLRELLAANAHLSMPEQKELLDKTFTNWIGNLEQVDDVTIIGVRI